MNKRIEKKQEKRFKRLEKKMLDTMPRGDTIKTDRAGRISNWNELSPQTKDWIING